MATYSMTMRKYRLEFCALFWKMKFNCAEIFLILQEETMEDEEGMDEAETAENVEEDDKEMETNENIAEEDEPSEETEEKEEEMAVDTEEKTVEE